MKRVILPFLLIATLMSVAAQETVIADKELLCVIPVGQERGQVFYYVTEEGFYGPGAPAIDEKAAVWLFSVTNKFILKLQKEVIEAIDYPTTYPREYLLGPNIWTLSSQQGRFGFSDYPSDLASQLKKTIALKKINPYGDKLYPLPNGVAIEFIDYTNHGKVVSIEYNPNTFSMLTPLKREYVPRTNEETRAWLPTQPGGFTIGNDGLLYRNGMVWSAIPPKDWEGAKFLGRLKSDHILWGVGTLGMESWFLITNAKSQIELQFSLPWRFKDGLETDTFFNYGVGPWGELYCLIAPPRILTGKMVKGGDGLVPEVVFDSSKPAELVVVRNHLKYFGRLNDGGVRLRKEPNTTSQILGTYPNKTGFRILERTGKDETIGGSTSDWVKVRLLDGKEGWFFGAFVHNLYDGPNGTPPPWPNVPDW